MIATNGLIHSSRSEELQRILYSAEGRKLFFLMNPFLRPGQPPSELAHIEGNLAWMQGTCTLGTTLWNDEFDLSAYGELISRFHLNNMIRVSLSHPMVDYENTLAPRQDYARIGAALKRQGGHCLQSGIQLYCDCGFVACMFATGNGEMRDP